jgi:tRNA A37 N6-isopentenylltransferase MiaA
MPCAPACAPRRRRSRAPRSTPGSPRSIRRQPSGCAPATDSASCGRSKCSPRRAGRSHRSRAPGPLLAPGEWAGLFLAPERGALNVAIDRRFEAMLAAGALEEAAALAARRLDPALPVMRAHGVPHLIDHLAGNATLAEAASRSALDTRRYAKRQFTWARHQMPEFAWVAPEAAIEAGARALGGFR